MCWQTTEVETQTASEINLNQSKLKVNIVVVFPAPHAQETKMRSTEGVFVPQETRGKEGAKICSSSSPCFINRYCGI